jgi:hypothetical protein
MGGVLQVLQVVTGLYRCLQVSTGRVRESEITFTGAYRSLQVVTCVPSARVGRMGAWRLGRRKEVGFSGFSPSPAAEEPRQRKPQAEG